MSCRKSAFDKNSSEIAKPEIDRTKFKENMATHGINLTDKQVETVLGKNCGGCGNVCGVGKAYNATMAAMTSGPQG